MAEYKYVSFGGESWGWQCHTRSKVGFRTAKLAATDLANALGISVSSLEDAAKGKPVAKPAVPQKYSLCRVLWHKKKLGWYSRGLRKYFVSIGEAMKRGNLSLSAKRVASKPGLLRNFAGVTWSTSKRAWIAQHNFGHGIKQFGGLFSTRLVAIALWV